MRKLRLENLNNLPRITTKKWQDQDKNSSLYVHKSPCSFHLHHGGNSLGTLRIRSLNNLFSSLSFSQVAPPPLPLV